MDADVADALADDFDRVLRHDWAMDLVRRVGSALELALVAGGFHSGTPDHYVFQEFGPLGAKALSRMRRDVLDPLGDRKGYILGSTAHLELGGVEHLAPDPSAPAGAIALSASLVATFDYRSSATGEAPTPAGPANGPWELELMTWSGLFPADAGDLSPWLERALKESGRLPAENDVQHQVAQLLAKVQDGLAP